MGPGRESDEAGQMKGSGGGISLAKASQQAKNAAPADNRRVFYLWEGKRAGGRITVSAVDAQGQAVRLANVDTIRVDVGKVVATHRDGEEIILAV